MTALHIRTWKPDLPPRAHLLIVHGYGEHSGRYEHLADALTALGIEVHAYDLRWHGKSPGKRGYITRFDTLVDDLAKQLEALRTEAGEMPLFLFAHSMGGLVACDYLARGDAGLAGAILSSPLLAVPEGVSPWLLRLAGVLGIVLPWLPVDHLDSSAISRIDAEVAAYDADPLVYHGSIHARTGAQLSAAISRMPATFSSITVPFLLIQGTADRLAPPAGGRRLYGEAGSTDKSCLFQEGGYHELLNDLDRDVVMAAVVDWLHARLSVLP